MTSTTNTETMIRLTEAYEVLAAATYAVTLAAAEVERVNDRLRWETNLWDDEELGFRLAQRAAAVAAYRAAVAAEEAAEEAVQAALAPALEEDPWLLG